MGMMLLELYNMVAFLNIYRFSWIFTVTFGYMHINIQYGNFRKKVNFKTSDLITRQSGCWLYGTDNQISGYLEWLKMTKNSYEFFYSFRTNFDIIWHPLWMKTLIKVEIGVKFHIDTYIYIYIQNIWSYIYTYE